MADLDLTHQEELVYAEATAVLNELMARRYNELKQKYDAGTLTPSEFSASFANMFDDMGDLLQRYAQQARESGMINVADALTAWGDGYEVRAAQAKAALSQDDIDGAVGLILGVANELKENQQALELIEARLGTGARGMVERALGAAKPLSIGYTATEAMVDFFDGNNKSASARLFGLSVGIAAGMFVAAGAAVPAVIAVTIGATVTLLGTVAESAFNGVASMFGWEDPKDAQAAVLRAIKDDNNVALTHLGNHLFWGTDENDVFIGFDDKPNDMVGGGGDDILEGNANADYLNGGNGNDNLQGDAGDDTLKGGRGDDTLNGGVGNDSLNGGAGFDVYKFSVDDFQGGATEDTIVDEDGQGRIIFDGLNISGTGIGFDTIHDSSFGTWLTSDEQFRLAVVGAGEDQTLTITHRASGSRIVVNQWKNGDLGIELPDFEGVNPHNSAPLTNDDDLFGAGGSNGGNDEIDGLAGSDGLDGGAGSDVIDGGFDNDLILGGSGNDRLFGSYGNDVILDGSELINFVDWSDSIGSDGKSQRQHIEEDIAQWGASVVARGKGWYIHLNDADLDSGFTIVTAQSKIDLDPNLSPSGDDFIDAGEGVDRVFAGEGNDTIIGGAGDDTISGGHDDDTINGGDGDDRIYGDQADDAIPHVHFTALVSDLARKNGNDLIDAGAGNDQVAGGGGNDIIYGGDGDDRLAGRGGSGLVDSDDEDRDYIDGGLGNDTISGDDGDDTLLGGEGNDVIRGDNASPDTRNGNDRLFGGAGDDQLGGDGGDDVLYGEDGADTLIGDGADIDGSLHGTDLLYGGAGNDILLGFGGDDSLDGGDGDDVLVGDANESELAAVYHGNDYLSGGVGNDELQGNGGDDVLVGGLGDDRLFGGNGNDVLDGGEGKDELVGGEGNDRLAGGADNDKLWGEAGEDELIGGDGTDDLAGGVGDDRLYGDAGNDLLHGDDGADVLDGGDGDDALAGDAGDDILFGGAGNDLLHGGDGADVLDGGDGHDSMAGDAGNDTITGGLGDDLLDGGEGADQLNGGEGGDTLYGGDGGDVLTGGSGNDVLIGGIGNDTYQFGSGFGQDWVAQLAGEDAGQDIISFGSDINAADLRYSVVGDSLTIRSVSSDDVLTVRNYFNPAVSIDIHFDGGGIITKDALAAQVGLGGTPILGSGSVINGTDGNDRIYGDDGDNEIHGLFGNDFISGGAGDDRIYGGAGENVLQGDAGNDTYFVGMGYTEIMGLGDFDSGTDTINLPFTTNSIVNFQITGDTLAIFSGPPTGGFQVLLDGFLANGASPHVLHFSDGTELTAAYFAAGGSNGVGTEKSDLLVGDGSDDRLYGKAGDDTLLGGGGDDYLQGDSGFDVLVGGDGNDTLVDSDRDGEMRGGPGDDGYYVEYNEDRSPGYGLPDIIENAGEGTDTIFTNAYRAQLPDGIENLVIKPSAWLEWTAVQDTGSIVAYTPRAFGGNDLDNVMRVDISGSDGGWSIPANTIYRLDGGLGADTLIGSTFDEMYVVDRPEDVIVEPETSHSFDIVQASYSYHLDSVQGIEEVQLLGSDDISAWGTEAADVLNGSTSNGSNELNGGAGNDRYVVDDHDTIVEGIDGGTDTVTFTSAQGGTANLNNYTNVENAELGDDLIYATYRASLQGSDGNNILIGNHSRNVIHGDDGNDVIYGENSLHPYRTNPDRDELFGDAGNDTIFAGAGGAGLHGGVGDDLLVGNVGADHFYYDIGDGGDTLQTGFHGAPDKILFGQGIDPDDVVYSRDGSTLVVQVGADPTDQLRVLNYWSTSSEDAGLTGALGQLLFVFVDGSVHKGNLEQLPLVNDPPVSHAGHFEFDATEGREVSYGIPAGTFTDEPGDSLTLSLQNAPDWLTFDAATGVVSGTAPQGAGDTRFDVVATDSWGQTASSSVTINVFRVVTGTAGADNLVGTGRHDEIHGVGGNDILDDGGHRDRLIGGEDDDTYEIHNGTTVVFENPGEGFDVVNAHSDYTLSANIEKLVLVEGSGAWRGTGNGDNNTILGNSASNRLDGGAGADTLTGGLGDDTYVIDNAGDQIIEAAGEGEDTVESSIDYVLGATLENLTLLGTANLNGTGNDQDNVLIGNDGSNRLEGGLGADSLYGGSGDDYFIEESSADWVYENTDEGLDTVERRYETNLVLKDNVENLILASGVTTGNGNELDNAITGNADANTLGGWDGDDLLQGLAGDDALFGGNGSDQLLGGTGNDYLDGGTGIDQMEGGAGNDTYIIDDSADVVTEGSNAGTDAVQTTASYTLSAHIENLFLMEGAGAIDGTGNALDNYLSGNSANNVLNGMGGNDTMAAGGGDDLLIGGTGDDKYVFDATTGSDVVDNTGGGNDGVFFTNGVDRDRLSFARDGDDLLIFLDAAATPSVRVTNHFLGGDAAIDYVQPDGGFMLTTAQINQIVAGGGTGGQYDQIIEGTAAGEQLVGSVGKDLIKGLGGDDQLFGMAGDDTLQGGEGDDYLAGGNGSGTGSGADRLEGGAGSDTLSGEDGDNMLLGGSGDDSYVYGGGRDTIDNTDGGFDGVYFNDGITASQLGFSRDGDDLLITVDGDTSSTVRVSNHFLGGDYAIDYVQPATGSMLDTAAINALIGGGSGGDSPPDNTGNDGDYTNVVEGTSAGEQLLGSSGRDLVHGLGGNDTIFGFGGDDKFDGGDGDDYLSGGNGSFSGSGNDILIGGAGVDTLVGEDGDDVLIGGSGNDKYVWQAGSGSDLIDNTGGGTDWLFFNGVDRTRLSFHQDADDLVIMVDGDASQQVRVQNQFLGGDLAISYVQPSDGYAIPASQFGSLLTPMPAGFAASQTTSSMFSSRLVADDPIVEPQERTVAGATGARMVQSVSVQKPAYLDATWDDWVAEAAFDYPRWRRAPMDAGARFGQGMRMGRETQQLIEAMSRFRPLSGEAGLLHREFDLYGAPLAASHDAVHRFGEQHVASMSML